MHDELTEKDIQKMEEEIEHRKLVVRKKALEDVKEARAHGDLSENFEYKAAKKFKNENESRIRYLEKMIKTAVIISEESAEDEVGMNNTVDVYFEEQNIHSMSGDGELMLTILASYAQEESLSASENQKWRVRANFKEGKPWNCKMLGYRYDGEKFVIYSSSKRIDIGGSKDINLKEDYGFTKENGTVSQLGKTAISDKMIFLIFKTIFQENILLPTILTLVKYLMELPLTALSQEN